MNWVTTSCKWFFLLTLKPSEKFIKTLSSVSHASPDDQKCLGSAFSGSLHPHDGKQQQLLLVVCFFFGSDGELVAISASGVSFWSGCLSLGVNSAQLYWIYDDCRDARNKIVWEPRFHLTQGRFFNFVSKERGYNEGCMKSFSVHKYKMFCSFSHICRILTTEKK